MNDLTHVKRPYSDSQKVNEIEPLCGGDRFATYVVLAEGQELEDLLPCEEYCQKCLQVHEAKNSSGESIQSGAFKTRPTVLKKKHLP